MCLDTFVITSNNNNGRHTLGGGVALRGICSRSDVPPPRLKGPRGYAGQIVTLVAVKVVLMVKQCVYSLSFTQTVHSESKA